MLEKIINKKKYKGLSIFQASLFSYFGVGFMTMAILGGGFWYHEQDTIKKELKTQFLNSTQLAVSYFDNVYARQISQDLKFIQRSYNLNAYLSSSPSEMLFTKSLAEQLFLNFTSNTHSIYLSGRYIDSKGVEKIITRENKRVKNYISLNTPSAKGSLDPWIRRLYHNLKISGHGTIMFEGPFDYKGHLTFLVGSSVVDPEVGGFTGVVIFHCDLQDYQDHLSWYNIYGKQLAAMYGLDGKPLFISGQKRAELSKYPLLHSKQQMSGTFYQTSDVAMMGDPQLAIFQVVLNIPKDILLTRLTEDMRSVFPLLLAILFYILGLSFVVSRMLSDPLKHLVNSAQRLGEGDFLARTSIKMDGELGVLFDSFNEMAERLSVYRDHLEDIVRDRTDLLQASEKRLAKLNNVFLQFGPDPLENINTLTGLCGESLGAHFAFYCRIKEDHLPVVGQWQLPADFVLDKVKGSICSDVIKKGGLKPTILQDLQKTNYAGTSLYFLKHHTNTFIGMPVNYGGVCIGALCVTYRDYFTPGDNEYKILGILSAAISVEEGRFMAEEKLREAIQKAQQASAAKSQFLANMSHEIRTPMNAIVGFSYLLQRTTLDEAQKDYVNTIKTSSDMLLSLISDILDISKIEADSLVLERISFDLEYLVGSLVKIIKAKIQGKNIDLVFEYLPGTPVFFIGDPTRIRQIILNLLGNASKFTESGEIKVSICALKPIVDMRGTQKVSISIKDTGIGIPHNKQEAIFHLFTQADESTTRKYGGTGLGLSIARSLAQKMGGDVTVSSEPGKGSVFVVTLSLETVSQANEKNISLVDVKSLKSKKVAIVDDNESSVRLIERYCKDTGMNVIFTADRALKLLTWIAQQRDLPEIIILDIMMPEMSGMELTKRLREVKKYDPIKLIAATSDARPGTAKEAQEAGFDAYLPKPIFRQEMIKIIQVLLGDHRETKQIVTRHTAEELSLKGIKVLIVEDQPVNQQLMDIYMDILGCSSDYANDGQEAIDKMKNGSYDVCLMDLQMPVMGGLRATEIIRSEVNKDIPIIALTAAAMREDEKKSLGSGMNDYLTKPIDFQKLKILLLKWTKGQKDEYVA